MPLSTKWSKYSKVDVQKYETDNYGIYELANSNELLYVGEGKVRERLVSHFPGGDDPTPGASHYRTQYTQSKERAVQRQNAELKAYMSSHNGKLPRFNQKKRG